MTEPIAPLPRWSLACLSLLHGAIFGWAASALPWRSWTLFAIACGILAALHALTGALAALRHRALALAWRGQSLASLAFLIWVGWGTVSSAVYLRAVYGGLGDGLAVAILAVLGLVVLVTLPLACWGIAATGGLRPGRPSRAAAALTAALALSQIAWTHHQGQSRPLHAPDEVAAIRTAIEAAIFPLQADQRGGSPPSLMTRRPATCEVALDSAPFTLAVTFTGRGADPPRPEVHCLQGPDPGAIGAALEALLKARARPGYIKLDLITHASPLSDAGWISSLAVRPGLDGLCKGKGCLMPWQIVASGAFDTFTPVESIPSARMGVSLAALDKLLVARSAPGADAPALPGDRAPSGAPVEADAGAAEDGARHPWVRIATASWLLDRRGRLVESSRARPSPALTPAEVKEAASEAQRYILWAQRSNGRFRYIVNPYQGSTTGNPFSIARQAGTTMALCELGDEPQAIDVIQKSIDHMASLERRYEIVTARGQRATVGVLMREGDEARESLSIGSSALALVALLKCRPRVGSKHDAFIGRLAALVLNQQRADGGFAHVVDLKTGGPHQGVPNRLYVDGQAILGLVLLEAVAEEGAGVFPAREEVRAAAERGMNFVSGPYWDHFMGQFFAVEENWNCLAAAAALGYHRHDAYERFCLDYVEFKSRFIHDGSTGASPDFLGGWGFGNLVPPHNTSTAGYGEALSAAIAVSRGRGEDTARLEGLLKGAMAFLVSAQWRRDSCFACSSRVRAAGGFSEHMASSDIRIDFVQHAWAALGHGSRALGWSGEVPAQ